MLLNHLSVALEVFLSCPIDQLIQDKGAIIVQTSLRSMPIAISSPWLVCVDLSDQVVRWLLMETVCSSFR